MGRPLMLGWRRVRRWVRCGLLALLVALVLVGAAVSSGAAQLALPDGLGSPTQLDPPEGVTRYGNMETMPVVSPLSNLNLFTIAAPTVYNRSPEAIGDRQTVEQRAQEIRAKLLLLLQRPMDPDSLVFEVSQLNNVAVVDVRDEQFPRPLVLLSVTEYDADFNGQAIEDLAADWRDILETELRSGLANLPSDRRRVNQILLNLALLTAVLIGLKYGLGYHLRQLRRQRQALRAAAKAATAPIRESSRQDTETAIAPRGGSWIRFLPWPLSLDRQIATWDFVQWLLFWLLILAWYGGFTWIVAVSPYLVQNRFHVLDIFLSLISIWFVTGLGIRLARRLVDGVMTHWQPLARLDFLDLGDQQRRDLRSSTIAGALKGLVTLVIALVGLLSALAALGLPTASVVAIGSLAGLALTFGSQNLVKDLVNGFFILAEDQYAIGDWIDLGHTSGVVENLNLRVTQIRAASGELVTIPNSSITQVKNLTRNWSRVNFSIDVAYHTDPDKALHILQETAQHLYTDPVWHDKILTEPTVLGIDHISHGGLTLTTWIQTAPAQQWAVGREFSLRVRRALEAHGIEIGIPQYYSLPKPTTSCTADLFP